MPRHDDFHAHFGAALHDLVEIVHLKPQQYTISVWLIFTIADRTVMVFYLEAVQLKDNPAIKEQLLVLRTPMATPAAQQTLIPSAACFYIGYGDERLRTHRDYRNNSSLTLWPLLDTLRPVWHVNRNCAESGTAHGPAKHALGYTAARGYCK
jgi:hypothetical protein